jgi:hypothetical protein
MNLTSEAILQGVAKAVREQIAPALTDPFASEVARLAAALLSLTANDVDDAAAARIWENAAMRQLFAHAASQAPEGLSARLTDAAQSADPGYRISELDGENGRLRRLLVELHAYVEVRRDVAAVSLDQRIWKLLGDVRERRAPRS